MPRLDRERRRVVHAQGSARAVATGPYPHTVVIGMPSGSTCWSSCRTEMTYSSIGAHRVAGCDPTGMTGGMSRALWNFDGDRVEEPTGNGRARPASGTPGRRPDR